MLPKALEVTFLIFSDEFLYVHEKGSNYLRKNYCSIRALPNTNLGLWILFVFNIVPQVKKQQQTITATHECRNINDNILKIKYVTFVSNYNHHFILKFHFCRLKTVSSANYGYVSYVLRKTYL